MWNNAGGDEAVCSGPDLNGSSVAGMACETLHTNLLISFLNAQCDAIRSQTLLADRCGIFDCNQHQAGAG